MGRTEGGSSAAYGTLQMVRGSYRPSLPTILTEQNGLVKVLFWRLPSRILYPLPK